MLISSKDLLECHIVPVVLGNGPKCYACTGTWMISVSTYIYVYNTYHPEDKDDEEEQEQTPHNGHRNLPNLHPLHLGGQLLSIHICWHLSIKRDSPVNQSKKQTHFHFFIANFITIMSVIVHITAPCKGNTSLATETIYFGLL